MFNNWLSLFFVCARLAVVALIAACPTLLAAQDKATIKDAGVLQIADLRFDNFLGIVSTNLEVKSGDEAGLKFFVEGFSREERRDDSGRPEYRVQMSYSIDIQDPEGKSLQPPSNGKIQTILGLQDEAWRPSVEWSVRIPDTAPTGPYSVAIRLTDEIGEQSIERTAVLRVRGPSVKATGQFEITQIEFAPSEDGPWRPIWYFETNSTIFVRYKLTGYTVSPENQISVEQDWAVLDVNGEEVISQPAAMIHESKGFYPPRFLQSYFSVSLRRPEPGAYSIRVDARDTIGEKTASAEARFVLRQ